MSEPGAEPQEPLPEETDNSVRPEDGPQDVDQEPHFEEVDGEDTPDTVEAAEPLAGDELDDEPAVPQ